MRKLLYSILAIFLIGNTLKGQTQINSSQIRSGSITDNHIASNANIYWQKINFTGFDVSVFGVEHTLTFLSPLVRSTNTISLGVVPTTLGGTGLTSFTAGGVLYSPTTSTLATSSKLYFDSGNFRLGINLSGTPSYNLDVNGTTNLGGSTLVSSGNLGFGAFTASYPMFKRAGTSVEVKLGDDSAYTGLTLGSLKLTSGATSGYVLTSDASGNATWASPSATPAIGLTPGRVTLVGTGPALIDDSGFTFSGTGTGLNVAIGGSLNAKNFRDITSTNNFFAGSVGAAVGATGNLNTGVGNLTLENLTTGTDNVAVGTNSLQATTTGLYNTAVGSQTLKNNIDGFGNTGIGHQAGKNITNGVLNTLVGDSAGFTLVDGSSNVLIGLNTGTVGGTPLTSGSANTLIGTQVGVDAIDASGRIGIGHDVMVTADDTAVIGNNALTDVYLGSVTSQANILARNFITSTAGDSIVAGKDASSVPWLNGGKSNTAIGYQTLKNNNGGSNIAMGYQAMSNTTFADKTVGIGFQALQNDHNGTENVAIGYAAGSGLTSWDYNVFIGSRAGENINSLNNVAIGQKALNQATAGSDNTAIGQNAMFSYTDLGTGYGGNMGIGANSSVASGKVFCQAIGTESSCNNDYQMVLGGYKSGYGYTVRDLYVGSLDAQGIIHALKYNIGTLTTADALADNYIGTSGVTKKGLVIQGKAGQTAHLFELQDSTGTANVYYDIANSYFTINPGTFMKVPGVEECDYLQSPAGNTLFLDSTSPVSTAGPSIAGGSVYIRAGSAAPSTATPGAALGGTINLIAKDAARYVSGNASGGSVNIALGMGVGTGLDGALQISSRSLYVTALWATANGSLSIGTDSSGANGTLKLAHMYSGTLTTVDALADNYIGTSATTQKGVVIQTQNSQTAPGFEIQRSDGTSVFKSALSMPSGYDGVFVDSIQSYTSHPLLVMASSGNTVHLGTNGSTALEVGTGIMVSAFGIQMGSSGNAFGTFYQSKDILSSSATNTAPDANISRTAAATYSFGNGTAGNATGTIQYAKSLVGTATTADALADNLFATSATTQKGLVIQTKSSQTANAFEVQDNTGAANFKVGPGGLYIDATGDQTANFQIRWGSSAYSIGMRTAFNYFGVSVGAHYNQFVIKGAAYTDPVQIGYRSGYAWGTTDDASSSSPDTALYRTAAGTIALGNGTAGDFSGTLKTTNVVTNSITANAGNSLALSGAPGNAIIVTSSVLFAGGAASLYPNNAATLGVPSDIWSTLYVSPVGINMPANTGVSIQQPTTLTESNATGFATLTYAASKAISVELLCRVQADDGTDYQSLTSRVRISSVRKATGNTVSAITLVGTDTLSESAGGSTLSCTYTVTEGASAATVNANCVSSLTQTTLNISFLAESVGPVTVAKL